MVHTASKNDCTHNTLSSSPLWNNAHSIRWIEREYVHAVNSAVDFHVSFKGYCVFERFLTQVAIVWLLTTMDQCMLS